MQTNFTDPHFPIQKWLLLIMRTFILLLCTTVFSLSPKNSLAQKKITIKADKEVSIDEVFDIIKSQTEYRFLYPQDLFRDEPKIQLKKGRISVNGLLKRCLASNNFNIALSNNNTIVVKSKDVFQEKQVSGNVVDEEGLPLEGVTIIVKGTTIGTTTDSKGDYNIRVPYPENILVFSFLGFKTQEIQVKSNTMINVILNKSNQELDEVVLVSTGYQKIPKERTTGSFSFIDQEGLEQRITTNLVDRLEGLTPGLTVKQNGKIEIRGQGTLFGETNPLIVVDGFPLESDISTINPSDIESITVLKDAAAASIYGAQAANGVVVVTTHKVKRNSGVTLEASTYKTITLRNRLSDLQFESSADRVEIELEALDYIADNFGFSLNGYELRPYVVNPPVEEAFIRNYFLGNPSFPQEYAYTREQRDAVFNRLRKVDGYGQIEKYLMRNAIQDQYNISLRQGGEDNQFYGSLTYNTDQFTSIGNNSDRVIANLKNTFKFGEKVNLQLGANVVYANRENNSPMDVGTIGFLFDFFPYKQLVDDSGNRVRYNQINFLEVPRKESQGYLPYTFSPLDVLDENDNTTTDLATRLNVGLDIELLEGLVFNTKFQYERNHSKSEENLKITNPEWRSVVNSYTLYDEEEGSLTYQLPLGGRLKGSKRETSAWIARNQLNFDRSFLGNKHSISALVGMEVRKLSNTGNTYNLLGYDQNTLTSGIYDLDGLWNYSEDIRTWWGGGNFWDIDVDRISDFQKRDVSYYGNASYIYNGKYVISGSGRLDQANIFGLEASARDNFLWSSGLSWALSKEDFFNVPWIDKLTLRGTYGVNGNRPAPGQTSFLTGRIGSSRYVDNQLSILLTNPSNPGLKSEKVKAFNLGMDYQLFNGKITGTLEYYRKKSFDLIGPKAINPTNGWNSAYVNYAELENTGVELNLNAKPIRTDNFEWQTTFNFSKNSNKVTNVELDPIRTGQLFTPFSKGGYLIKDDPVGRMYTFKWAGLDSDGRPQIIAEDGSTLNWQEARSRGFDKTLLHYQGTSIAPYYGGLSNTFKYKNFRLDILMTYKFGHKMKAPRGFDEGSLYSATYMLTGKFIADRWRQPGDEAMTDVPGYDIFDFDAYRYFTYYKNADINILDASHIRLTDVNLSYDISPLIANGPFENLTLSFQGKNLWLWVANNEGVDPEANFDGVLNFPRSKSFVFGIKARF